MEQGSKRLGRPTKAPAPGNRVSLGLKVTSDIKQRLDDAARASGRTQSQEAELRLERSFEREDLLGEVLALAYGEFAPILILIAAAMDDAGRRSGQANLDDPRQWTEIPFAYDQAIRAGNRILEVMRPEGEIDPPHDNLKDLGELCANFRMVAAVEHRPGLDSSLAQWGKKVSPMLSDEQRHRLSAASDDVRKSLK